MTSEEGKTNHINVSHAFAVDQIWQRQDKQTQVEVISAGDWRPRLSIVVALLLTRTKLVAKRAKIFVAHTRPKLRIDYISLESSGVETNSARRILASMDDTPKRRVKKGSGCTSE